MRTTADLAAAWYLLIFLLFGVVASFAAELGDSSAACVSHYGRAAAPSAVDGKTLVALRVQEEHTKFDITSAVSDFEKSLNRGNAAGCKKLSNAADLWINGARANGCEDLIESTYASSASPKPKLRNENVELLYSEARVTLDAPSRNERHIYLLQDVHERWIIKCFASSPLK